MILPHDSWSGERSYRMLLRLWGERKIVQITEQLRDMKNCFNTISDPARNQVSMYRERWTNTTIPRYQTRCDVMQTKLSDGTRPGSSRKRQKG